MVWRGVGLEGWSCESACSAALAKPLVSVATCPRLFVHSPARPCQGFLPLLSPEHVAALPEGGWVALRGSEQEALSEDMSEQVVGELSIEGSSWGASFAGQVKAITTAQLGAAWTMKATCVSLCLPITAALLCGASRRYCVGVVLYESSQVASGGGAPLQCRHLRLSDLRPGPAMEALLHMALGDGPGISEWWRRYNKAREARRQPGELQDHSLLHVAPVGGAEKR